MSELQELWEGQWSQGDKDPSKAMPRSKQGACCLTPAVPKQQHQQHHLDQLGTNHEPKMLRHCPGPKECQPRMGTAPGPSPQTQNLLPSSTHCWELSTVLGKGGAPVPCHGQAATQG